MEHKLFFFACPFCYEKLISGTDEVGAKQSCSQCKKTVKVPNPPKRIPPYAKITNVFKGTRESEALVAFICPYCRYKQEQKPQSLGQKNNCPRCGILFEIPKPPIKFLGIKLSNRRIKADGVSTVQLTVYLEDDLKLPVPQESVQLKIVQKRKYHTSSESSPQSKETINEIQVITNQNGIGTLTYHIGRHSRFTEFYASVQNNLNLKAKTTLEEFDGIDDGELSIESINFPAQEKGPELFGNLILENNKKQSFQIRSIQIYSDPLTHPGEIAIVPLELKEKDLITIAPCSKETLSFVLKKQTLDDFQKTHTSLKVFLDAQNKETLQIIQKQQVFKNTLELLEPLNFQLETSNQNQEQAGVPFYIKAKAFRGENIVHSFSEEISVSFEHNATQSPNGEEPQVPKQTVLSFKNGIGITQEPCVLYSAHSSIFIEATLKTNKKSIIESLSVSPTEASSFQINLTSPQTNNTKLSEKNTIFVLDTYGNIQKNFLKPIKISLSSGSLEKDSKTIHELTPSLGQIDLSATHLILKTDSNSFPFEVQLTAQAEEMIQEANWFIHPSPSKLQFEPLLLPFEMLEQNTEKIQIPFNVCNQGDSAFVIDSIDCEFFTEDVSLKKIDLSHFFKTKLQRDSTIKENPASENQIPGKTKKTLTLLFSVLEKAPTQNFSFKIHLKGKDSFHNQVSIFSSEISPFFKIEPTGRQFKIQTQHEKETAGKPFSLQIETYFQEELDTNYNGKKQVYFASKETSSPANQIPEKVEIHFVEGIAETPPEFIFFQTSPFSITARDNATGGARGSLFINNLQASEISDFQINLNPSQINSQKWQEKNILIPLDSYQNRIPSTPFLFEITPQDGKIQESKQVALELFSDEQGVIDLTKQQLHLQLPYEKLPYKTQLLFKTQEIQKNTTVEILPCPKTFSFISFEDFNSVVEQGTQNQKISARIFNQSETTLKILSAELHFYQEDTQTHHFQEKLLNTLPCHVKPKQEILLQFETSVATETSLEPVKANLVLNYEETFYETSEKQHFDKQSLWTIEPLDRAFEIVPTPTPPQAGSFFHLQITVNRNGKQDTQYNGKHTIQIKQSSLSSQKEVSFPPKIPESIEVDFFEGKGESENLFCFYKTKTSVTLSFIETAPGGPQGQIDLKPTPGDFDSFVIEMQRTQVANTSFQGDFKITAFDTYQNIKEDFQETVAIHNTGIGKLFRSEKTPEIKDSDFKKGVAFISPQEFFYKTPASLQNEEITLLFKLKSSLHKENITITPEPGHLEIQTIRVSEEVLEWEKEFQVSIVLGNQGGSKVQLLDVSISFIQEEIELKDALQMIDGATFPHILEGQEKTELVFTIRLNKDLPLGAHQVKATLTGKDLYYKNILEAQKISQKTFQIEPSGRVFKVTPLSKAKAWEPFALQLSVFLNEQEDPTYEGKRTVYCRLADDLEEKLRPPTIPFKLTLDFKKGEAVTPASFQFFHRTPGVLLELHEKAPGGAYGKTPIKIQRERLGSLTKRKKEETITFVQKHRRNLSIASGIFLLLLLLWLHWRSVEATKRLTIVQIRGTVQVEGKTVQTGEIIYSKQNIKVSEKGFCLLQMANGTLIKLYGSSRISTNTLGRGLLSSTYLPSLEVKAGRITYKTNKEANEEANIKIPDADKLNIESDHFQLGVEKSKSLVSVYSGKIGITSGGKTVSVPEGKGSSVTEGKAASPPSKLPESPQWVKPAPDELITQNTILFEWSSIPKVSHYVLEISERSKYPLSFYTETSRATELKVREVDDGLFSSSISCVDENGFASLPSSPLPFEHKVPIPTREILVKATCDDTNKIAKSLKILVNGQTFKNGDDFELGEYEISITKEGYFPINEKILLQKDIAPFIFNVSLKSKIRPIVWQWKPENFPNLKCIPEQIFQNKKSIAKLPSELKPGKYSFSFKVPGFHKFEKTFRVPAGEIAFEIPLTLKRKLRETILKLQTKIKALHPPKVFCDNQPFPSKILPGKYQLKITQVGFKTIEEPLIIPPSDEPFTLQKELSTKKRTVSLSLELEIPSSTFLEFSKATLTSKQSKVKLIFQKEKAQWWTSNSQIEPGNWELEITSQGYISIKEKVLILPEEKPYTKKLFLKTKELQIHPQLNYDYDFSSVKLSKEEIYITPISKENHKGFLYKAPLFLKPGKYLINIKKPGFIEQNNTLDIQPSDTPFLYPITLQVKPRKLIPKVFDPIQKKFAHIIKIFSKNTELPKPYLLLPGKPYHLKIEFKAHETILKELLLPPSDSAYQIQANIKEFPIFLFKVPKHQFDLKKYPVLIKGDNRLIPKDLVLFYDFGEIFYCEYQAPQKTKQLFIEYGFYYTNVSLENLQTIQWSNIHWEKLKQYLKMLSTQKQFSYIETLLKVDFSKIQKWDLDTLQMFYNYIKNLHLEDPKWAQKRQKSLEKLKKLLPRSIKEN